MIKITQQYCIDSVANYKGNLNWMFVVASRSTRMMIACLFGWHILISYIKASEKHVFGLQRSLNHCWRKGQCFVVSRWLVESWFLLCLRKLLGHSNFLVCGCIWSESRFFLTILICYIWWSKYLDFSLIQSCSK